MGGERWDPELEAVLDRALAEDAQRYAGRSPLEQFVFQELDRQYAERMKAEIDRFVYGGMTGEPIGIWTEESMELYRLVPEQRWICRRGEWIRDQ